MCGIFAYLGKKLTITDLAYGFEKIKRRGPDNSLIKYINDNIIFGFHRLSINDLSNNGNQPLEMNGVSLICNGEIYNHVALKEEFGFTTNSGSDCEIILHLYRHFNGDISKFIHLLDGVFAFVLYDSSINQIVIARDPFGVRPLFIGIDVDGEIFLCSELKGICELCNGNMIQFPGGTYSIIKWNKEKYIVDEIVKWFNDQFKIDESIQDESEILSSIRELFYSAVHKRLMSDRPICCLLSGGLDSSLVAAIVAKNFPKGHLHTFSIGMEGSPDLYFAKIVANHIDSVHHEVILTEAEFLEAIPETINVIESYDTTTVRASVGNYLISKYISENTNFKVVYNGDGSDEFGSYLYFSKAPSEQEFHNEAVRLLNEIRFFDVLRSDRSISSNGLEPRVPFLDKKFASYYASIPPKFKMHSYGGIEKYILRKAFECENLLPPVVLWRSKMAFSDGVSQKTKSWHKIISEYTDSQITDKEFENNKHLIKYCPPQLKESYLYRLLFDRMFGSKNAIVIPHFWLPKWCGDIIDPSARELPLQEIK
jgi:asparagine synthase (glutamine-hydrolysing)